MVKISRCKSCKTRFSGLRCPNCGHPLPIVIVVTLTAPIILGLSLVAWAIPDEMVPRSTTTDGKTSYVFQSLEEAVLYPVGAVLFVCSCALQVVIYRQASPGRNSAAQVHDGGFLSKCKRLLGYFFVLCIFGLLCVLFLDLTIIKPLTAFREIEVSDDTVVCRCLYRSDILAFADIRDAYVLRERRKTKGKDFFDCSVILLCRGVKYQSAEVQLTVDDDRIPLFLETMEKCVTDINKHRVVSGNGPRFQAVVAKIAETHFEQQ